VGSGVRGTRGATGGRLSGGGGMLVWATEPTMPSRLARSVLECAAINATGVVDTDAALADFWYGCAATLSASTVEHS